MTVQTETSTRKKGETNTEYPQQKSSVLKTLEELQAQGFPRIYGVQGDQVLDQKEHKTYPASSFRVCKLYRFEGATNPSDESVVIAIQHVENPFKGVLVMAYGPSASVEEQQVLQQLQDQ